MGSSDRLLLVTPESVRSVNNIKYYGSKLNFVSEMLSTTTRRHSFFGFMMTLIGIIDRHCKCKVRKKKDLNLAALNSSLTETA